MQPRLSAWAQLLDIRNINHGLLLPILLHCMDDQGRPLLDKEGSRDRRISARRPHRYPSGRRGHAPILDADPLRTRWLTTAYVDAHAGYDSSTVNQVGKTSTSIPIVPLFLILHRRLAQAGEIGTEFVAELSPGDGRTFVCPNRPKSAPSARGINERRQTAKGTPQKVKATIDLNEAPPIPSASAIAENPAPPSTHLHTDAAPTKIQKSELTISEPRRHRDKAHLKFVASQPCLVCGRSPADAHHLRFTQLRAMGRKVSDEFTVPLCRSHHRDNHRFGDEVAWWERRAIDPVATSRLLWVSTRRIE